MEHISETIDDILTEWAYRVNDGMPDVDNPLHMAQLEHSLYDLEFPPQFIVEFMSNLREADTTPLSDKDKEKAKKLGLVWKRVGYGKEDEKGITHKNIDGKLVAVGDEKETEKEPEKPKEPEDKEATKDFFKSTYEKDAEEKDAEDKGETDDTTQTDQSSNQQEINNEQQKTENERDKGIAGAGGPVASQGEARYCNACNNLNEEEFKNKNRQSIDKKKEELRNRKLKKAELETIKSLGLSEEEGLEYLASREVWAEQELERIKKDPDSVFYKKGNSGFRGDDEAYLEWMRTAYDGALATQKILDEDTDLDTSKPHTVVQSTPEVDAKVEAQIRDKIKNAKTPEEKEYYEKELKSWKKYSKYHDTYAVGVDSQGRMHIVHISNKKDDQLRDPHNNTTPAQRFSMIKEKYGDKVAKNVVKAIDDSIKMVTKVREKTAQDSSNVEVDDDLAAVAEKAAPKYLKQLDDKATSSKDPFGKWVKEKGVDWNNLSQAEKLKVMQQFMKDESWHKEKGPKNYQPPYSPFSKIFVKVGEASQNQTFWDRNPGLKKSNGTEQSIAIKNNEKSVVTRAHENVVKTITEEDKKLGFPKDGVNGPNTQGYIDTVLDAMHFNTYIDGGDGKMIVQMGIEGAQPKHVRNCLAKLSGFEGDTSTPEGKEALKKYLREKCRVEADTGAVHIEGPDGKTQIADDTWRTAGDSQKVASGFGKDMRNCIKSGVKETRTGK